MFSSNKNNEKPDTQRIVEKHFVSILQCEIRDALPDEYELDFCTYLPPHNRVASVSIFESLRLVPEMRISIYRDKRQFLLFTIQLPTEFNMAGIVKALNVKLRQIDYYCQVDLRQAQTKYFCDLIVVAPFNPKHKAVFVTGDDPLLGENKRATRLSCFDEGQRWRFFVPYDVTHPKIDFYEGDWLLGKEVPVHHLKKLPAGTKILPIEAETKPAAETKAQEESTKITKKLTRLNL